MDAIESSRAYTGCVYRTLTATQSGHVDEWRKSHSSGWRIRFSGRSPVGRPDSQCTVGSVTISLEIAWVVGLGGWNDPGVTRILHLSTLTPRRGRTMKTLRIMIASLA